MPRARRGPRGPMEMPVASSAVGRRGCGSGPPSDGSAQTTGVVIAPEGWSRSRRLAPGDARLLAVNWLLVAVPLAAALLVAFAAFIGVVYAQRRTDRREATAAQSRASVDLLTQSLLFAQRAHALLLTAQVRTGLSEVLVVLLRLRRPVDPMELHDWLQQGARPLYDAWSATWVSSSPALVTRGNAVIDACTGVLEAVSERAPVRWPARLREAIAGRGADKDQAERLRAAIHALAGARRDYAELVRKETGKDTAELFFRAAE